MSSNKETKVELPKSLELAIKRISELSVLEAFKKAGFEHGLAGVLYGMSNVGKTLTSIILAKDLYEAYKIKPLFLVTESNWFFRYKGYSIFDLVKALFGDDSIVIIDNPLKVFRLNFPDNTFIVFDSLGAIAISKYREIYRQISKKIESGEEKEVEDLLNAITLITSRETNPLINAIVSEIVTNAVMSKPDNPCTVLFIAHETAIPMRKYREVEDTKPSFSSRAGHHLVFEYRLLPRFRLKVIVHRFRKDLEGKVFKLFE